MTILAKEGFRAAPTQAERVFEAAKLFSDGQNPANYARQATLQEAFTTSDFPVLLGAALEREAMQAQKAAVKEYEPFSLDRKLSDFRPKKLVDLFGNEYFEDVAQGEEYKGGTLAETDVEIKTGKTGKSFGLTWELQLSRDFTDLADFPRVLGNAAVNTENRKVYELIVGDSGLSTDFFGTVDTKALTADNLQAAIEAQAVKTNHRDELVDISALVLVVGPALQFRAQQILNAQEIETTVSAGSKTTKTRQPNPFKGLITLQVSREFARLNGAGSAATSWALLPAKSTDNPAVVKTGLIGHENVDIRVKRDQGARPGGGDVPVNEGSFNDDTIWYRGRHVTGAAQGFTAAVYGSDGTA
ncbi:Mu-like prophage major head subunit gpT family protein [Arthrobacter sp. VKM Ac-2550]|uniref:Mu-like prophage major head subunit gpT family protein n=1 Tax=Crystallibacter permensis TaxID=1938888 RepID=UPI0022267AF1|nr:Mu-like prophage major head subunit gpT family protein [Arthrobacter sp. VKM Ac-2550]MCW2132891.1 Mu-like prophage major head subunit gpT [Arthrobacter sp. VKM Ac-2550]